MKASILHLDIETSPSIGYWWGNKMYKEQIIKEIKPGQILAYSVSWDDEAAIYTHCLQDRGEAKLVAELVQYLNVANVVVGHNVQAFDLRWIKTRAAFYGTPLPSPYQVFDTLKAAKKAFRLPCYKLGYLVEYFGLGKKRETGGFNLWEECAVNNPKAWGVMKKYNRHDVVLQKLFYNFLLPYAPNHPNLSVYTGTDSCPSCNSLNIEYYDGYVFTTTRAYAKFRCRDCFSWGKRNKAVLKTVLSRA